MFWTGHMVFLNFKLVSIAAVIAKCTNRRVRMTTTSCIRGYMSVKEHDLPHVWWVASTHSLGNVSSSQTCFPNWALMNVRSNKWKAHPSHIIAWHSMMAALVEDAAHWELCIVPAQRRGMSPWYSSLVYPLMLFVWRHSNSWGRGTIYCCCLCNLDYLHICIICLIPLE